MKNLTKMQMQKTLEQTMDLTKMKNSTKLQMQMQKTQVCRMQGLQALPVPMIVAPGIAPFVPYEPAFSLVAMQVRIGLRPTAGLLKTTGAPPASSMSGTRSLVRHPRQQFLCQRATWHLLSRMGRQAAQWMPWAALCFP